MPDGTRRVGLAALLVSALVADVGLGGIESLVVRTETAAGFFSRLGFSPVDRAAMLAIETRQEEKRIVGGGHERHE